MSFGCPKHLELYRLAHPFGGMGDRQNGALVHGPKGLTILFSSGEGWEHVSVSRRSKTPSYEDMVWVKQQFWSDDECVMQLHVPEKDHVNCHPNCLHLWRPINESIPRPPSIMVGPK